MDQVVNRSEALKFFLFIIYFENACPRTNNRDENHKKIVFFQLKFGIYRRRKIVGLGKSSGIYRDQRTSKKNKEMDRICPQILFVYHGDQRGSKAMAYHFGPELVPQPTQIEIGVLGAPPNLPKNMGLETGLITPIMCQS